MQRFKRPNQPEMVASWFIRSKYSQIIPTDIAGVITSFYNLWAKHTFSNEEVATMKRVLQIPGKYGTGSDEPIIFDLVVVSVCGLDFKFELDVFKCPSVRAGITFKAVVFSLQVYLPDIVQSISGHFGGDDLSWLRADVTDALDERRDDAGNGLFDLCIFSSFTSEQLESEEKLTVDYCCDIQQVVFQDEYKEMEGIEDIGYPLTLKKDTYLQWKITGEDLKKLRQEPSESILNQPLLDLGFDLSLQFRADWLILTTDYAYMPCNVYSYEMDVKVQCAVNGKAFKNTFEAELTIGEGPAPWDRVLHQDDIGTEWSLCLDIELIIVKVLTFDKENGPYSDYVEVEKANWEKYGVM